MLTVSGVKEAVWFKRQKSGRFYSHNKPYTDKFGGSAARWRCQCCLTQSHKCCMLALVSEILSHSLCQTLGSFEQLSGCLGLNFFLCSTFNHMNQRVFFPLTEHTSTFLLWLNHLLACLLFCFRSVEQCFHMCDRVVIYFFIAASYTPWWVSDRGQYLLW